MAYVKERKQFGKSIAEFQGLQFMIADMAMKVEAARHLVYVAAAKAERGEPNIGFISGGGQVLGLATWRWRSRRTPCSCSAAPATPATSRWSG